MIDRDTQPEWGEGSTDQNFALPERWDHDSRRIDDIELRIHEEPHDSLRHAWLWTNSR